MERSGRLRNFKPGVLLSLIKDLADDGLIGFEKRHGKKTLVALERKDSSDGDKAIVMERLRELLKAELPSSDLGRGVSISWLQGRFKDRYSEELQAGRLGFRSMSSLLAHKNFEDVCWVRHIGNEATVHRVGQGLLLAASMGGA
mmetsp:Transcript_25400/g.73100  ORF Transcript_25400/g.73100 Transcript_25400/m.73100 type:complete len:144 (+) Transcript_25400:842-1273(+)